MLLAVVGRFGIGNAMIVCEALITKATVNASSLAVAFQLSSNIIDVTVSLTISGLTFVAKSPHEPKYALRCTFRSCLGVVSGTGASSMLRWHSGGLGIGEKAMLNCLHDGCKY